MKLNTIYHGDAIEVMDQLPYKSIDLIFTSPPYNLKNSTGNGMKDTRGGKWENAALQKGYTDHADAMDKTKYLNWQRNCLVRMWNLLTDDGAIFYNHKPRVQDGKMFDPYAEILFGLPVRQAIIWRRPGGINFNAGYFLPTYEVIYMIAKSKFVLKRGSNAFTDVWEFSPDRGNPHPAPFPVALAERVIGSTNAKVVLDPFIGSGTTAVAAINLNRDFIGIDNSEDYVAMAWNRIQNNQIEKDKK